jgi:hypothetical protein
MSNDTITYRDAEPGDEDTAEVWCGHTEYFCIRMATRRTSSNC